MPLVRSSGLRCYPRGNLGSIPVQLPGKSVWELCGFVPLFVPLIRDRLGLFGDIRPKSMVTLFAYGK